MRLRRRPVGDPSRQPCGSSARRSLPSAIWNPRDGVFAPVVDRGGAGRERTEEWLANLDERKVITSLLNMAVSRHAHRRGLKEDNERQHRFSFPPREGLSWSITWKPIHNTVSREVAGQRRGPKGEFWRHAAGYLTIPFLGNRFYLKVDPTWVFTVDGEQIMRGYLSHPVLVACVEGETWTNLHPGGRSVDRTLGQTWPSSRWRSESLAISEI
jgi:hypothetical protein